MKRVLNKKVLFGLYDDEEVLKDAVKEINKEGMTVFVITHEEDIAAETDRIVRLRGGVIISDELTGKKVKA